MPLRPISPPASSAGQAVHARWRRRHFLAQLLGLPLLIRTWKNTSAKWRLHGLAAFPVLAGQPMSQSFCVKALGEYQLLEELGRGGMGRVYKALHTKLDRVVAVKVLPRGRVGDQQAINRFEREMKAVGRLAHPNIVQAYDAREIDGTPVLIMEFVDGLDLAEIVRRRRAGLPVADACELVRRTALGAAMRPRARAGPSRHQAVEHHARPIGRSEAPGPRPGPLLCRGWQQASRRRLPARR